MSGNKKFRVISSENFFSLATLVSLVFAQTATASFKSASEFDQHSTFEQNVKTANPPGQTQPQPNPYRNNRYNNGDRSERQYYEEVTPTNIEEDRSYLLQNHPIQEAPLPRNRV